MQNTFKLNFKTCTMNHIHEKFNQFNQCKYYIIIW